jgi:preprotein translocase subunit SecE
VQDKSLKTQTSAVGKKRNRFAGFFVSIWAELKKVTWPSRQEAVRLSLMVLALCVAIGVVLGLLDWGFSSLFNQVLVKP